MVDVKFTCNICGGEFVTNDPRAGIPLGWGAIRPTLRVKLPNKMHSLKGKDRKKWNDFEDLKDNLKKKLWQSEYHVCHECLCNSQGEILKIEERN